MADYVPQTGQSLLSLFYEDMIMERITQKNLEHLVDRINEVTGSPLDYCVRCSGLNGTQINQPFKASVGHYHLDYAYGGVKLVRMVNEGGGISVISTDGYGTKRELYNWLQAFLAGIAISQTNRK